MTVESGEEAVGFALDGREIALRVLVAAAGLEQLLDCRRVGKRRPVNFDARQLLSDALLLDSRPLRFLARDAQFVERRLQALRHTGREVGQVAERRQLRLRFPNAGEERRRALEPVEARPLDIAGAALGAQPVQLAAKLIDILVELYPCIAAELLFANCGARRGEAFERLIEAAILAGARREHAVCFAFEGSAEFGKSAQAGCRRHKARADIAVRPQHFVAAGAQPVRVEPERALEHLLAEAAEERRERVVRQRIAGGVEKGVLAPLAPPKSETAAVGRGNLPADPQWPGKRDAYGVRSGTPNSKAPTAASAVDLPASFGP